MKSVLERIEDRLDARLQAVDGTGVYAADLAGRIAHWQATADEDLDARPCAHIVIGPDVREPSAESEHRTSARTVEWDVLGAADGIEGQPGVAIKRLAADLETTLERVDDLCLVDPELGRPLLRSPLVITSVTFDVRRDGSRIELVVIRVRTVWEHVTGRPDVVLQ